MQEYKNGQTVRINIKNNPYNGLLAKIVQLNRSGQYVLDVDGQDEYLYLEAWFLDRQNEGRQHE